MANWPPIRVNSESTPGQHVDYLHEYLRHLGEGEGRGLDAPLMKIWVANTQGMMVPMLARALANAALAVYRHYQPPTGDRVDDLIRRLEEADAKVKAKGGNPKREATKAIGAWNQDMRRRRITHPDVVDALRQAGLMAHEHFKKPS